jgi:hypothetical protein
MINIQEPRQIKFANILKGISILLQYDCTADISINPNFTSPAYCIDTSVDSKDLFPQDLEELHQLGWKEIDRGHYIEWYYLD